MRDGASFIIDFLVDSWIQISDFYDNDIFNNELPKDYIDKFIKNTKMSNNRWATKQNKKIN